MKAIENNLRAARFEFSLSLEEVEGLSGVSSSAISRLERGEFSLRDIRTRVALRTLSSFYQQQAVQHGLDPAHYTQAVLVPQAVLRPEVGLPVGPAKVAA